MLSPAAIADLNARTDLRGLAEQLGARLNRRGIGSCPLCGGGKTAQRFELKDQETRWVCAVCADGGDAIKLVMKARGIDFPAAVDWLGGIRQIDPAEAARREREIAAKRAAREAATARYREEERRRLYDMWSRAAPGGGSAALIAYFALRGVGCFADLPLRFAADVPYFDGDVEDECGGKSPRLIYRGAAMLAPMVDAARVFRGLHITWLDLSQPKGKARICDPETGEELPAKKMRGSKAGTFIPLSRGGDPSRLRAAEGIETTLTLRDALRDGATYQAGGDLGNLAGKAIESVPHATLKMKDGKRALRIPGREPDFDSPAMPVAAAVDEILWGADGDSDPQTTHCAMDRAVARHDRPGRVQRVLWAPEGKDWNDLARGQGR
jgi:hypothetical protein